MKTIPYKEIYQLTPEDLRLHPVWTWAGSSEEPMVTALELPSSQLPTGGRTGSLFVRCHLIYRDGTRTDGYVAVEMSNRVVYILNLPAGEEFAEVPLQPGAHSILNRREIELKTGKTFEEIFPVVYSTPYVFDNGKPLAGAIANPD